MEKLIYSNVDSQIIWNPKMKAFLSDETKVRFASSYEIVNPKTKNSMIFDFSHSTGPEFEPSTIWVYKSKTDSSITLQVANDPKTTAALAGAYLQSKTKR